MPQHRGRALQVPAHLGMPTLGTAPQGDDVVLAEKGTRLAVDDLLVLQPGGAANHKDLVAVRADLGQRVVAERVLDRQRVKTEAGLKDRKFIRRRIHHADPGELMRLNRPVLDVVQPQMPQAVALRIDPGGGDRHLVRVSLAGVDSVGAMVKLRQRLDSTEIVAQVAFSTKLSMTFFSPALSNATVSLLPSTPRTVP